MLRRKYISCVLPGPVSVNNEQSEMHDGTLLRIAYDGDRSHDLAKAFRAMADEVEGRSERSLR